MKKLIIVLFFSIIANAENRKSDTVRLPNGKTMKAEIILTPLSDKDFSFSDVIIEKATLLEITKRFGPAKTLRTGDAGTSNSSICYFGGGDAVVRFNSGEMGGGKTITDIEVFDKKKLSTKGCSKPTTESIPISNNSGIKLGLTRDEIVKKFGKASYAEEPNTWNYMYSSKLPVPKCDGGWDVTESYKFKFEDDKVISFSVSKVTSC